ncbi:MAG TPA: type II toxin-antitoxin system RelE/ParE family toxin [Spirochaetia bacterium]|nr:MAG: hypothetical protein A2Y41_13635 [Spirochaetes bacterium GWB1_36_13]HCL55646.1 type II toxin-antitoxin system RelE/ParE family toxin [Spirochaetia bacterium]
MIIQWTEPALQDLESIKDFIQKDSKYFADLFISKIFDFVSLLKKHPNAGKILREYPKSGIRELIYKNYRIIYQVDNKIVYIISVIHSNRNLKNIKKLKEKK